MTEKFTESACGRHIVDIMLIPDVKLYPINLLPDHRLFSVILVCIFPACLAVGFGFESLLLATWIYMVYVCDVITIVGQTKGILHCRHHR